MKKVFIDCGAHEGESIRTFRKLFEDAAEYEMHSFEANPDLFTHFDKLAELTNFTFHPKAVWKYDGVVNFYIDTLAGNSKSGSSINSKKKNLRSEPISAPCIDLANWITSNYSITDYIILKLDIEGAEYDLVEHLIGKNAFAYIDVLYIEFHSHKMDMSHDIDKQCLKSIRESNPKIQIYHDTHIGFQFTQ
jgi:FkbM family methyltransferase